jgi:uncharacterized protein YyaL (SSP411 family)
MHPTPTPRNRLAAETSPYLLQHAGDPVDWYAWGPEALGRARELDRPVFLSVGYAACHWCHVMHRESFGDPATAEVLNAGFVSIKVDREERPDVDALYMDALQALTGGGGWPMSVFLTPDGRPFHAGTYYPDTPRHGAPAFREVLAAVTDAWRERRADIEEGATRLADAVAKGQRGMPVSGPVVTTPHGWDPSSALDEATATLIDGFDARIGAWGGAPLFPQPMVIEHLVRESVRTGDERALAVGRRALDAMAAGGIRDHLGGGFARYATDARWLVPHFEKMLYDNAQLALVYLHAWQATGDAGYRDVVVETLGFLERELLVTDEDGVIGFASSLDADTDGIEGATYVWTRAEVRDVLGDGAALFESAYGVTEHGNWEGTTVLARVREDAALARDTGLEPAEVAHRLEAARRSLYAARQTRPAPARDDKVIAAWNGLALLALAEASQVLEGGDRYASLATEVARSLRRRLSASDGRLHRSWKDGRPGPMGVLEDHADLAAGLLALYQATFDETWFGWASDLMRQARDRFGDPEGGFYDTADDATDLFTRPRSLVDGATPSGNAMAATVLATLHAFTGDGTLAQPVEPMLARVAPLASRHPTAFPQWLAAIARWHVPLDEVAIIGNMADPRTAGLLEVARSGLRPWQVVALAGDPRASMVPLLGSRDARPDPTAWVCHGGSCRMPVSDPEAFRAQLRVPPA